MIKSPLNDPEQKHRMSEQKIPLWIHLMWILGTLWVLGYIVFGLLNPKP